TIRVWDFATGKELRRIKCYARDISLGPDGRTLAAAAGEVLLWDLTTGKQLRRIARAGSQGATGVRLSPDGKTLAVVEDLRHVVLYDAATGKRRLRLARPDWVFVTAAFSPDGKRLVTGGGGYKEPGPSFKGYTVELKLWDVAGGKELRSFPGHAWAVA